jgi:hypothetical protein
MGAASPVLTKLRAALVLGRVSNLPTLLSNALAGAALSGGDAARAGGAFAALALFYVGGMYLNDAFDAEIDARERPARPIPAGAASRAAVFVMGGGLLALGLAASAVSPSAFGVGAALALCVFLYDATHKRLSAAPLLMGACRVLAYLFAAAATGGDVAAPALWLGAAGLFLHIVGLTYAARREAFDRLDSVWPLGFLAAAAVLAGFLSGGAALAAGAAACFAFAVAVGARRLLLRGPGDISGGVALLIAATSLYDAALAGGAGASQTCALAALCFPATLLLQKRVPGT